MKINQRCAPERSGSSSRESLTALSSYQDIVRATPKRSGGGMGGWRAAGPCSRTDKDRNHRCILFLPNKLSSASAAPRDRAPSQIGPYRSPSRIAQSSILPFFHPSMLHPGHDQDLDRFLIPFSRRCDLRVDVYPHDIGNRSMQCSLQARHQFVCLK